MEKLNWSAHQDQNDLLEYMNHPHHQGRQSGLKRGGAQRGRAGNFGVYLAPKYELCKLCPELSGRGRKSGGARALLAPPRMAPLQISYAVLTKRLNT